MAPPKTPKTRRSTRRVQNTPKSPTKSPTKKGAPRAKKNAAPVVVLQAEQDSPLTEINESPEYTGHAGTNYSGAGIVGSVHGNNDPLLEGEPYRVVLGVCSCRICLSRYSFESSSSSSFSDAATFGDH